MNKEKATIYDYVRMCNSYNGNCCKCELYNKRRVGYNCTWVLQHHTDESNEIILNWCKEHPVKTRQDKFLEMFPNAHIYEDGVLEIKPCHINETAECGSKDDCDICRSKYWLAEVEDDE